MVRLESHFTQFSSFFRANQDLSLRRDGDHKVEDGKNRNKKMSVGGDMTPVIGIRRNRLGYY